ncbi:hypothetical protein M885DRAFT_497206 [Pelagophyceae sp. CCMP2097]|nr:hypothetical protein M885DRAFT_497206 [Pelagophyceae sp. CCMP2097]|mmetsp:Transcript_14711/g.52371  ORF Transcript_14711/g.52371 Transcript_14711/m.52371 type:complete len:252 (-) Transcript_14711:26-781(-)
MCLDSSAGTLVINAANANDGRAKHLVRNAAFADCTVMPAGLGDSRSMDSRAVASRPSVVSNAPSTAPSTSRAALPEQLLAIDLGHLAMGCACFSRRGLKSFAGRTASEGVSFEEAIVSAAIAAGVDRATHVVTEGTDVGMRDRAVDALAEAGLLCEDVVITPLVNAAHWRVGVLLPKERKNAKTAKSAARDCARQLAKVAEIPDGGPDAESPEVLTTDAAEAICLGAWTAKQLGWTEKAIVSRFTNGNVVL